MRPQDRRFPRLFVTFDVASNLISEDMGLGSKNVTSGVVAGHFKHREQPRRNRQDPVFVVLRRVRQDSHLPTTEVHFLPLQQQQLTQPTAGFERRNDHSIQSAVCDGQKGFLFART